MVPLGVVDVALAGEVPVGLRLTELGRNLLLGERIAQVVEGLGETAAVARLQTQEPRRVGSVEVVNVDEAPRARQLQVHALQRDAHRREPAGA